MAAHRRREAALTALLLVLAAPSVVDARKKPPTKAKSDVVYQVNTCTDLFDVIENTVSSGFQAVPRLLPDSVTVSLVCTGVFNDCPDRTAELRGAGRLYLNSVACNGGQLPRPTLSGGGAKPFIRVGGGASLDVSDVQFDGRGTRGPAIQATGVALGIRLFHVTLKNLKSPDGVTASALELVDAPVSIERSAITDNKGGEAAVRLTWSGPAGFAPTPLVILGQRGVGEDGVFGVVQNNQASLAAVVVKKNTPDALTVQFTDADFLTNAVPPGWCADLYIARLDSTAAKNPGKPPAVDVGGSTFQGNAGQRVLCSQFFDPDGLGTGTSWPFRRSRVRGIAPATLVADNPGGPFNDFAWLQN